VVRVVTYAEDQPRDGDRVLHCGHILRARPWHWFKFEEPVSFRRPDGTTGSAAWIVACDACFREHGADVRARGDGLWTGDEPTIEEPTPS
jgi:hypothetical protein